MTPHEFLRVLVDSVAERLQAGEPVGLPGIGSWHSGVPTGDGSGPDARVYFVEGESSDLDDAILRLATSVGQRTGHDVAGAATGLHRFSSTVRRALDDTGRLDLPGLGTFVQGPDGIGFHVSSELAEVVAWQTVQPAGTPGPAPSVPDTDSMKQVEEIPTDSVAAADPAPTAQAPEVTVATPAPAHGISAQPAPTAPIKPAKPVSTRASRPDRTSRRWPIFLFSGVIVIAVVVAWVLSSRPPSQDPEIVASNPPVGQPAIQDSVASEATAGAEPAAGQEATTVTADPATAVSTSTRPPAVRPSADSDFDTSSAGYTLVASSTPDSDVATRYARTLRDLGYPVAVLAYTEDANTRFRVGVGIFPSSAAADSVRRSLSDRLPEGTWVRRIRP